MIRAEFDADRPSDGGARTDAAPGAGDDGSAPETYPATAFFADYKRLDLPETDLSVAVDGAEVTVAADDAALFVELDPGTIPGAFSDNYVHLAAGEERTVAFEAYDDRPGRYARDLVDLLDEHAKDDDHGGYVEYFTADWEPVTEGQTYLETIEPDWSPKESDDSVLDPTLKLTNTHLHLMEAFTTYYEVFGADRGRERLHELFDSVTNTVYRTGRRFCTDKYEPDWTPRLDDEAFRIVSYGHDLEGVWLAMEAADALGLSTDLYTELFETLWDYSLEYGYDEEAGGFYFYGGFDEPASFRVKAWWVQAECLTSALRMYEHTGDERYREVFEATWEFLDEHQIDRERGEWHSGVTDDLEPVGRKGAVYKAAYHNGRALLECVEAIDRLCQTTENIQIQL